MNPRTRRLRRIRRNARKREERGLVLVRDLRTGKQFRGKLNTNFPSYVIRIHATFDTEKSGG